VKACLFFFFYFLQNEWLVQRHEERSAGWSTFVDKMCDRCNTVDEEFASEVKRVEDYYKDLEQKMMKAEMPRHTWYVIFCNEWSIHIVLSCSSTLRFIHDGAKHRAVGESEKLPVYACSSVCQMLIDFWATVTSNGSPVVLSVTLVYCGQTVWWIKMPLGTEVCLGPG